MYVDKMERRIAKFLKQKRKAAGLTQEEFALKTGVSLGFLRKIEQEKSNETLDLLNQALSMFGANLGVVSDNELDGHER
jgi:transcriptional regulator with XRE-family HTH domain